LCGSWPTETACSAQQHKDAMQIAKAYPVMQTWLHFWLITSLVVSCALPA